MVHPDHGIYSGIKRDKAIWLDLKGITMTEKSQSLEIIHCMIPFIERSGNYTISDLENRLVAARSLGGGVCVCWGDRDSGYHRAA